MPVRNYVALSGGDVCLLYCIAAYCITVRPSFRVKGMFLRPKLVGSGSGSGSGECNTKAKAERRRHKREVMNSLIKATGGLLAHVSAAISFMEEWLKTDYPFKRCTQVRTSSFFSFSFSHFSNTIDTGMLE